ncbi:MAG: enoyl-CoA hydratase-related protein [Candidimonas sp.]
MKAQPLYDDFEFIQVERSESILRLTLNRPDVLNAIHGPLHAELARIFERVAVDRDAKVVVLRGAGRAFCAGGEMEWIRSFRPGMESNEVAVHAKKIIRDLLDLPQPIIAAVHGVSAGLGTSIALCCDYIAMGESARIGDPHVRVGLVAGDGGALIWPLLVGVAKAKEYLMTGDLLTAREAERLGLVNRVVPDDMLMDEITSYAERLLAGSQPAIRGTKAAVNQLLKHLAGLTFEYSLLAEQATFGSDDVQEGTRAMEEKRKPVFRDGWADGATAS